MMFKLILLIMKVVQMQSSFNDHADWGSIVLVDVGRLDTDDIIIDSGAVVG